MEQLQDAQSQSSWQPVSPCHFDVQPDGSIINLCRDMHFTRLNAPEHPLPNDSDACFHVAINKVILGQVEISFGAVPVDSDQKRGRVVGHGGVGEAGITLYGIGYRHGKGALFKDGDLLKDAVSKPINTGSVVKAHWSASSRTLSFNVNGMDSSSVMVPDGDYMFAATCDGGGACIGALASFTLPERVLTLQLSEPTAEGVEVQVISMGGNTLATLTAQQEEPFRKFLDALYTALLLQVRGQRQMVKLIVGDGVCGQEVTWSSDALPFAKVLANASTKYRGG